MAGFGGLVLMHDPSDVVPAAHLRSMQIAGNAAVEVVVVEVVVAAAIGIVDVANDVFVDVAAVAEVKL